MERTIADFRPNMIVSHSTTNQIFLVDKVGGSDVNTGEQTDVIRVLDPNYPIMDDGVLVASEHWFEPSYLEPLKGVAA